MGKKNKAVSTGGFNLSGGVREGFLPFSSSILFGLGLDASSEERDEEIRALGALIDPPSLAGEKGSTKKQTQAPQEIASLLKSFQMLKASLKEKKINEALMEALEEGERNSLYRPDQEAKHKSISFLDGVGEDLYAYETTFLEAIAVACNLGDSTENREGVLNLVLIGAPGEAKSAIVDQASRFLFRLCRVWRAQALSSADVAGQPFLLNLLEAENEEEKKLGQVLAKTLGQEPLVLTQAVPRQLAELFTVSEEAEKIKVDGVPLTLRGVNLVIDELDKVQQEGAVALANLLYKRRVQNYQLPETLGVICTANPSGFGGNPEFISTPALQNRLCTVDIDYKDEDSDSFGDRIKLGIHFRGKLVEARRRRQRDKNYLLSIIKDSIGEERAKEYRARLSQPIDFTSHRWKLSAKLANLLMVKYLSLLSEGGGKVPTEEGTQASIYSTMRKAVQECSTGKFTPFATPRSLKMVQNVVATCCYYGIHPRVRNALIGGLLETPLAKDFVRFLNAMLSSDEKKRKMILSKEERFAWRD